MPTATTATQDSRSKRGQITHTTSRRGNFFIAELARQIDVPVNRVTGIINGQRSVTADTALRLGHWFGTSPEFWLNLQTLYELRLARLEIGERVKKLPRLADRKPKYEDAPRPV